MLLSRSMLIVWGVVYQWRGSMFGAL